jgi:DNA-binding transcriptional ArsR family regulator
MYREAVKQENSYRILEALAKNDGVLNFAQIERISGVKGSTLNHHLNRLLGLGVILKEVKGTYKLRFKTPLCYIFGAKTPFAYLGLLGRRAERKEPETKVALELLKKEGIEPTLVYVATSPEALNEWKDLKLPYNWILLYEEQIIDVDAVKKSVEPQLESLLKEYIVILDCTSATKPATIAYYELAQTYCVPLIYVYEETKQLKWLISKDTLRNKFRIK